MRIAPTMCQLCFFFLTPLFGCWRETVYMTQLSSSNEWVMFCLLWLSSIIGLCYIAPFFLFNARQVTSTSHRLAEQQTMWVSSSTIRPKLMTDVPYHNYLTLNNPVLLTVVWYCDTVLPLPCDSLVTCHASRPVHAGIQNSINSTSWVRKCMDGWEKARNVFANHRCAESFCCYVATLR